MLNETPSLTLGALTPEEWAAHLDEAIKQNVHVNAVWKINTGHEALLRDRIVL